ncbi:unnamed protein product [Prunus armeniaca]
MTFDGFRRESPIQSNPINATTETKEKISKLELRERQREGLEIESLKLGSAYREGNGCDCECKLRVGFEYISEYSRAATPLKYSNIFKAYSRTAIPLK